MSLTYLLDGKKFILSYQELREKHIELCGLSDTAFLSRLPEAIHLACFISYIKELEPEITISDVGIIHELAHLMHIPDDTIQGLKEIRKQFKNVLKLD